MSLEPSLTAVAPVPRRATPAPAEVLRRELERFVARLAEHEVFVEPYTEAALNAYAGYPDAVQADIRRRFDKYASAVTEILDSGVPLRSTQQSLWCLFKKYRLLPMSDLLATIGERDIVEIYLPDQVQWYRSMNYFDYTSYSLGELICFPWHELIEHGTDHSKYFMDVTGKIFANEIQHSVFPDLAPSISRERHSRARARAELRVKIISPLVNTEGQNEAFAIVWEIDVLDPIPRPKRDVSASPLLPGSLPTDLQT